MDDAEATKILKRDAHALLTGGQRERLLDEFERSGRHAGECHGAASAPAQFQRQYWKRQNSIDSAGRHQGPLDDFDERPGE